MPIRKPNDVTTMQLVDENEEMTLEGEVISTFFDEADWSELFDDADVAKVLKERDLYMVKISGEMEECVATCEGAEEMTAVELQGSDAAMYANLEDLAEMFGVFVKSIPTDNLDNRARREVFKDLVDLETGDVKEGMADILRNALAEEGSVVVEYKKRSAAQRRQMAKAAKKQDPESKKRRKAARLWRRKNQSRLKVKRKAYLRKTKGMRKETVGEMAVQVVSDKTEPNQIVADRLKEAEEASKRRRAEESVNPNRILEGVNLAGAALNLNRGRKVDESVIDGDK